MNKVCLGSYHGQVLLQGQEKLWLPYFLQGIHVLRKQERSLQSLCHVIGMASLEFPKEEF